MMNAKTLVLSFMILFFMSGCAKNHEINMGEIEKNKNKTFKIGVVKVAGRRWGLFDKDNVEKKKGSSGFSVGHF